MEFERQGQGIRCPPPAVYDSLRVSHKIANMNFRVYVRENSCRGADAAEYSVLPLSLVRKPLGIIDLLAKTEVTILSFI